MRSVPVLLLLLSLLSLLFTRAVYTTETAARSGTDTKIDRPVTAKKQQNILRLYTMISATEWLSDDIFSVFLYRRCCILTGVVVARKVS